MIVNPVVEERKKLEKALLSLGYKPYKSLNGICPLYDQIGRLKITYEEKKRTLKIQGHSEIINVDAYCIGRNDEGKLSLYIKHFY